MSTEDKYGHETELEQAGRAFRWLEWLWNAKSVLLATFGFAVVAALAVLDFNLAWNLGLWHTVLIGSTVFALIGVWHFRRTPKKLAVYAAGSWATFVAFDMAVLFSGVLHEPHIAALEGYVVARSLAEMLEKDHKDGLATADMEEFTARHGLDAARMFDGKYYSAESYHWTLAFTEDGEFNGVIRVDGDQTLNLPSCTVTRNEKGRLAAKRGDSRKYLPVFKREDKKSSWFFVLGVDSESDTK